MRKFQRFIFKNTVALRIVRFGLTPTITPSSISIIYHLINSKELFLRFNLQDSSKRCLKKKKNSASIYFNFQLSLREKKNLSIIFPLRVSFLSIVSTLTTQCILVSPRDSRINALLARAHEFNDHFN